MNFELKTESTIDPKAIVLLGLVILIAGVGIVFTYSLAKR